MNFNICISLSLLTLVILPSACNQKKTDLLSEAFELAGENRSELEKVLNHYQNDSLKLKAAVFLIENMPGHYSYLNSENEVTKYNIAIDSILESTRALPPWETKEILESYEEDFLKRNQKLSVVPDAKIITADFLIANIDSAFSKWHNTPWGKHLKFNDFCEYLLPYKNEELAPLYNWRKSLAGKYSQKLRALKYCDNYKESVFRACIALQNILSDSLRPFLIEYDREIPITDYLIKAKMPFGTCEDYSSITTSVLRSEGVPVVQDFIPQWGFRDKGHEWNMAPVLNGKHIKFAGVTSSPSIVQNVEEKIPKIYRRTYSRNHELEELNNSEKFIPKLFTNRFIKDVSSEYLTCIDITIKSKSRRNGYAYLTVFNDKDWEPVDFALIKNDKITFKNVGVNCLYLPISYDSFGRLLPITDPLIVNKTGEIEYIAPDKSKFDEIKLYRKYPILPTVEEVAARIVGGEFQASNNSDFNNYYIIGKVTDPMACGHTCEVPDTVKPYRYWRYIQNVPMTFCNMSEIAFFDFFNKQITGDIIGTNSSWDDNPKDYKEKVFDGDILTMFNAPIDHGAWVGMDFGIPTKIKSIEYVSRGDGNSIEIGNNYELFYWDNGNWESLGKQIATKMSLTYRAPAGSLLLLKNHTKGKDERIFIYKNGIQEWW